MPIFPSTKLTLIQDVNNIFFCNFCATSGWIGNIATLPGGAVLTFVTTAGNPNTMVASGNGKQRLYNTTRGTYGLILSCVVGTLTITLVANIPAGWVVGDVITTITPNMAGKPYNYVDIEINAGAAMGNDLIFANLYGYDAGAVGQNYLIHPYGVAWSASKESGLFTQAAAAIFISNLVIVPLTGNVFSFYWTASGAATARPIIRQVAT